MSDFRGVDFLDTDHQQMVYEKSYGTSQEMDRNPAKDQRTLSSKTCRATSEQSRATLPFESLGKLRPLTLTKLRVMVHVHSIRAEGARLPEPLALPRPTIKV